LAVWLRIFQVVPSAATCASLASWGLEGFCCRQRNATALAARLGLLIYNLWHLFLRL